MHNAFGLQQRRNVILLAGGYPAAGDDHIKCMPGMAQSRVDRSRVVEQIRPRHRFVAVGAQQTHQQFAIAVVQLARPQRQAGFDQFIAGREHRHCWPSCDFQPINALPRSQRNAARCQHLTCSKQGIADSHILAGATHMLTGLRRLQHAHEAIVHAGVFFHHDAVRTRRHRRAGGDPHAFAGANLQILCSTSELFADQLQESFIFRVEIGMTHGEAIHR